MALPRVGEEASSWKAAHRYLWLLALLVAGSLCLLGIHAYPFHHSRFSALSGPDLAWSLAEVFAPVAPGPSRDPFPPSII